MQVAVMAFNARHQFPFCSRDFRVARIVPRKLFPFGYSLATGSALALSLPAFSAYLP
jgi:hypothetical protein